MRKSALVVPVFIAAAFAAALAAAQAASKGTAARGIPAGAYQTTITPADAKGHSSTVTADSIAGTWIITFDDKGSFTVQRNGTQVVEAVAHPRSGQRVYLDEKDTGPYACHMPATYRYSVRGRRLTFRAAGKDKCDGRLIVLTAHALERAS